MFFNRIIVYSLYYGHYPHFTATDRQGETLNSTLGEKMHPREIEEAKVQRRSIVISLIT